MKLLLEYILLEIDFKIFSFTTSKELQYGVLKSELKSCFSNVIKRNPIGLVQREIRITKAMYCEK